MKVRLRISKDGAELHSGSYEIEDARDFGNACAEAWTALRQRQLEHQTSIGALMENIDRSVLDDLVDARITIERAS
jgi:hypothetical protein